MKKNLCFIILFSFVLLNAKIWIREYTYQASEADSKITSRAIALEQVKRLLLQEIGVYVHSTVLSGEFEASGEVKDLSAKQIEIISAGITETKILEETWNGETYYIKAEITADENDVINRLDKVINDKEKTKQLEDSRQKTEEALAAIDSLKTELANTKDENEKLKLQTQYNNSSNELSAEDWFQKGINAYILKDFNNSLLFFQKAIKINSNLSEAYYYIGIIYDYNGLDLKAIEYYLKAIEIFPLFYEAHYNLGVVYFNRGEYQNSLMNFKEALIINPFFEDAYNNVGVIYHTRKEYDLAIKCYKATLSLNQSNALALYNLGLTYYELEEYDKSIENLQKSIKYNPNYARAFYYLGKNYEKTNDEKQLIKYYSKARDLDSDEFLLWYENDHKGELDVAKKDTAKVLLKIGYDHLRDNDKSRAIDCFISAIEFDSELIEAYQILGLTYGSIGEFDQADFYLEKVKELEDRNNQIRN